MEYRAVRISDIIKDNINRDYFLPAIQREFVWEPERIEKLFDSIMGDFPIGSFLFWKIRNEKKNDWNIYEFIRDYDGENPHNDLADLGGITRDINLILDGQQRITSLYIGLKGSYRYFYYRWRTTRLYLNLLKPPVPNEEDPEELTYQFEFREDPTPKDPKREVWYRVGKILDFSDPEDAKTNIEGMIEGVNLKQKDVAKKLIGKLHARIHTHRFINFYEESTDDYDKVLKIFVRANSAGKVLEYSDLLLSTATAKWEKLDARKEVHDFTDFINGIGSGYNFGKDFVLKGCLYITKDLPIQYKVKTFVKNNLIKIENNWENIKTYLSCSVRLVNKFGFNYKNIVAPLSLLPIAFFLSKKGNPNFEKSTESNDVKIQIQIRKWLIFALLKNAFGGSSDTTLKNIRDILSAMSDSKQFPMDAINNRIEILSSFTDSEIEDILTYSYQQKYTYLVLSLLYPDRDWKDTVFHEDHIFPKADFTERKLKNRGYGKDKIESYMNRYNTLGNLQILTDTENLQKNATPFEDWIGTRDDSFKKRHLIPDMMKYSIDSFDDFISRRKALITAKLKAI